MGFLVVVGARVDGTKVGQNVIVGDIVLGAVVGAVGWFVIVGASEIGADVWGIQWPTRMIPTM